MNGVFWDDSVMGWLAFKYRSPSLVILKTRLDSTDLYDPCVSSLLSTIRARRDNVPQCKRLGSATGLAGTYCRRCYLVVTAEPPSKPRVEAVVRPSSPPSGLRHHLLQL